MPQVITTTATMETRAKVAAAAASVVPFHCIICFNEFNMTTRPPVVLPCGHTYVCAPCSKRLRRCMECREPLFIAAPASKHPPTLNTSSWDRTAPPMYSTRGGRYSPSTQQQPVTPPQPGSAPPERPLQIALPIPKNVVLLAMMEAAQRQEKELLLTEESDSSSGSSGACQTDDEEEEYDLNRIISGMATLSGPCGTYAVRERQGLAVLSTDPRKEQRAREEEKKTEEEKDKAQQRDPFSLEFGQTVQLVDFEDGIAKLARGRGYIVASSAQLVKVGGPLDSACRLEGLLDTVVSRGRGLQNTLDENLHIENSLRKQVESAELVEPTHPIITDPPGDQDLDISFIRNGQSSDHPSTPTGSTRDVLAQPIFGAPRTPNRDVVIMTSASMEAEVSMIRPGNDGSGIHSPSPNSIDNSDLVGLPRYRRNDDDDDLHQLAFGCGAAFFGDHSDLFGESVSATRALPTSPLRASPLRASPLRASPLRASPLRQPNSYNNENARQRTSSDPSSPWMHSAPSSSSFDTVDFRTGLSGHRGLTHNAKSGSSPSARREVRSMGHHGGLGSMLGWPRATNK